jgi:Spy/CpxP family protein refolding chaperone
MKRSTLIAVAACAGLLGLAAAMPHATAAPHDGSNTAAVNPPGDDLGPMGPMAQGGPPEGEEFGDGPGMGGPGMGGGMGHGMRGMRGMGPRGFEAMLDRLTGPLALTAQQRAKLEDIHDKRRRDDIRAGADIQIARLDLRNLIEADNADRGAIESQIDRVAQLEASLHKSRVGTLLDGRAVLTAQQRAKLEELRHTPPARGEGKNNKKKSNDRAD